jgi:hypothetical protein
MNEAGTQKDQDVEAAHAKAGDTNAVYLLNEALFADPGDNIYRTVFPCNKSSSKQLMIALEPEKKFAPSVTLCKPGTCGVKMPEHIFLRLLQVNDRMTNFFNGASYPAAFTLGPYNEGQKQEKIRLGERHHLVFYVTKNNIKLVSLVYSAYESYGEVIFTDETWCTIMRLSVLVKHLLTKYKSYKDAAFQMYRGLGFAVHHEVLEISQTDVFEERVLMVQDFFNKWIHPIPIHSPNAEPTFDPVRAFEEIKLTCAAQIMEEVAEANNY